MQVYASCFSANRHLKHTVLNRQSPPRHIKSNNNTGQKKNKTLKVQVTLNRLLTEVSITWRVQPPRQRRHQIHSKFTLDRAGRPSTWWERCFEERTVALSSTSVPDSPSTFSTCEIHRFFPPCGFRATRPSDLTRLPGCPTGEADTSWTRTPPLCSLTCPVKRRRNVKLILLVPTSGCRVKTWEIHGPWKLWKTKQQKQKKNTFI